MTRDSARQAAAHPQGDLARLLETEQRLEDRVAAARAEAADGVVRAQQAAAQEDAATDAQLAAAGQALDATLAEEGRRRGAEIAAAAEAEVQAYDRVPAARIAAIAQALGARFLIGGSP